MVWNDEKEVLLLREAATVEPHKFKEKTKERGQCWQRMCENLRLLPGFQSLSARAVREKTTTLLDEFKVKQKADLAATGTSLDISEKDVLLEEISARIEEYVKTYNDTKEKEQQGKALGEEVRQKALETFAETNKRKQNNGECSKTPKRQRSTGSETVHFLKQKMETEIEIREKELQLEKEKLALETAKLNQQQENQNNFMSLMMHQMQQTQQLTSAMLEKLSK